MLLRFAPIEIHDAAKLESVLILSRPVCYLPVFPPVLNAWSAPLLFSVTLLR